jgi:hypothetical protein
VNTQRLQKICRKSEARTVSCYPLFEQGKAVKNANLRLNKQKHLLPTKAVDNFVDETQYRMI